MEEFQREYDYKSRKYKYMCIFWGHDGWKEWIPALQKWGPGPKLFFFFWTSGRMVPGDFREWLLQPERKEEKEKKQTWKPGGGQKKAKT